VQNTVLRAPVEKDLSTTAFKSKLTAREREQLATAKSVSGGGGGGGKKRSRASTTVDHTHMDAIESFLRTLGKQYADIQVDKVEKGKSNVVVFVRGNESGRFCNNVERCHHSNRIYFELSASGCVQLCTKQEDNAASTRTGLKCSEYRSRAHPIPGSLRGLLFFESTKKIVTVQDSSLVQQFRRQQRLDMFQSGLNRCFEKLGWDKVETFADLLNKGHIGCDGSGLGVKGADALKELDFTDSLPREKPVVQAARDIHQAILCKRVPRSFEEILQETFVFVKQLVEQLCMTESSRIKYTDELCPHK
jgi:hypothetical protein